MIRSLFVLLTLVPTMVFAGFRHERAIQTSGQGPARLEVDVDLIAGASDHLKDLRLFDATGREVGYLLVEPSEGGGRWIDGSLLPVASTKTASGVEIDLRKMAVVNRVSIDGLAPPVMKRATLEGSGDRQRWTLLADATVFDLPEQRLRMTEIPFTSGAYRYLRLTWDDRSSARISGAFRVRAQVEGAHTLPQQLRAPLTFERRPSEPGRSRYAIVSPNWKTAFEAIEIETMNATVLREARVIESRLQGGRAAPVVLGSATLRKAGDDASNGVMAIPLSAPESRELELVIDDGNNPPLAIRSISARFPPQPWIYFEPGAAPITARYGDDHLTAPKYDLEAVRSRVRRDATPLARWASPVVLEQPPNPAAIAGTQPRAAALTPTAFSVRRVIDQARPGLVTLPLDADVLAHSRSLDDVRIVDAADQQIPYVLEQREAPLIVRLTPEPAGSQRPGISVYRLKLPFSSLERGTIVLTTDLTVFQRPVALRRPADEKAAAPPKVVARGVWRAGDPDVPAEPFRTELSLRGLSTLELVIDEGDNAPLHLSRVELLLPSYALRFQHPGGDLFLLYGNPDAASPRYDLALLAPRVLREQAIPVAMSAAVQLPTPKGPLQERTLFWIVIAAAAVVLVGVLARVLRSAGDPPPAA